jgi:hypothetical protein
MKKVCILLVLLTYERNTAELKCLLNKESRQETLKNSEVIGTLQVIMDTFCHYFNIAFPYKSACVSKWITQSTNTSSKRMCFVNTVKKSLKGITGL